MVSIDQESQQGFLNSKYPVNFPAHPAMTFTGPQFESFLHQVTAQTTAYTTGKVGSADEITIVADNESVSEDLKEKVEALGIQSTSDNIATTAQHPFMKAIHSDPAKPNRDMENTMLTENADLAHRSSKEPLVDLFFELEEVVSGQRLRELLDAAWKKDPLATLKIIFNARSIHLGKSSRSVTYRSFGWLAQRHPITLLSNLQWLSRPVIEKKMTEQSNRAVDDDIVVVDTEKDESDPSRFDVKNGVAHGYWKDLLNILVLAIEDKLDVLTDPRELLNQDKHPDKSERIWDATKAKEKRHELRASRHAAAVSAFETNAFYRALHLTVARLFADQLKSDLALLHHENKKAVRQISVCAKWAPTSELFHDKHTWIVSTLAEILHPQQEFSETTDREIYLRHAREAYRRDISALRKALQVVERDIAAEKFENIHYDRVPSLAMSRYAGLFARKDTDRFDEYVGKVAEGQKKISGATLLPSTLVSKVRAQHGFPSIRAKKGSKKALVEAKMAEVDLKVLDGQWSALVQRIKDSGKLENSIAVADVSGSMGFPVFPDGSRPIDSSIGLALLLAEITAPPFGGSFITFSSKPTVQKVEGDTFTEKVRNLERADWDMSTDVVAVFDRLVLPMAKEHNVKQEDMVKQIFIFSDMQFDSAARDADRWSTSYERIKAEFGRAGYEMPQLVFWNLAGGRGGYTGQGDATAPKPVTATEEGTALVSGYSQGLLKVFLDSGAFTDPEAEEEIVEKDVQEGEDGEEIVQVTKKQKTDPMRTVRKAISHKAYDMLKVVD